MNDLERLIDKYFNSLNETNDQRRRRLIEEVWAENGKFASPVGAVAGYDAIDIQVQGFQKQFPDTEVRRTGKIDVLDDKYVRFNFEAAQADGAAFTKGVDFGIVADGKLQLVVGFFDFAPNPSKQ